MKSGFFELINQGQVGHAYMNQAWIDMIIPGNFTDQNAFVCHHEATIFVIQLLSSQDKQGCAQMRTSFYPSSILVYNVGISY
jgi:hypothetical protein